jgi:hypothetical protein
MDPFKKTHTWTHPWWVWDSPGPGWESHFFVGSAAGAGGSLCRAPAVAPGLRYGPRTAGAWNDVEIDGDKV